MYELFVVKNFYFWLNIHVYSELQLTWSYVVSFVSKDMY